MDHRFDMPPSRTNNKRGEKVEDHWGCMFGGVFTINPMYKWEPQQMAGWQQKSTNTGYYTSMGNSLKLCRLLTVDSYKPHWPDRRQHHKGEGFLQLQCDHHSRGVHFQCTANGEMHKQTLQRVHEGKLVQPMDRCINRPFKEYMRASWQEWMWQDKEGELKTTFLSRCHQLGIQSLGLHHARDLN